MHNLNFILLFLRLQSEKEEARLQTQKEMLKGIEEARVGLSIILLQTNEKIMIKVSFLHGYKRNNLFCDLILNCAHMLTGQLTDTQHICIFDLFAPSNILLLMLFFSLSWYNVLSVFPSLFVSLFLTVFILNSLTFHLSFFFSADWTMYFWN